MQRAARGRAMLVTLWWLSTSINTRESIMATQLTDIVESSQAERVATGFVFTEGPVWHPEGYWLFVDVRASLIYRLAPGGPAERLRAPWCGSYRLPPSSPA